MVKTRITSNSVQEVIQAIKMLDFLDDLVITENGLKRKRVTAKKFPKVQPDQKLIFGVPNYPNDTNIINKISNNMGITDASALAHNLAHKYAKLALNALNATRHAIEENALPNRPESDLKDMTISDLIDYFRTVKHTCPYFGSKYTNGTYHYHAKFVGADRVVSICNNIIDDLEKLQKSADSPQMEIDTLRKENAELKERLDHITNVINGLTNIGAKK